MVILDEQKIRSALLEGVKEVFETMIFMDVEPCELSNFQSGDPAVCGMITFTGEMEGFLSIMCDMKISQMIAMNMLGMDPEDEIVLNDIFDAIGEVSNMVIGSVKSRIEDDHDHLIVSIPSVTYGKDIQSSIKEPYQKVIECISIDDEYTIKFTVQYKSTVKIT